MLVNSLGEISAKFVGTSSSSEGFYDNLAFRTFLKSPKSVTVDPKSSGHFGPSGQVGFTLWFWYVMQQNPFWNWKLETGLFKQGWPLCENSYRSEMYTSFRNCDN